MRGYWHDAVHANQTTLQLARRAGDRAAEAHAHSDLGVISMWLGRHADAIASLQASLTLRRALHDRQGQAVSLNALGVVLRKTTHDQQARAAWHETLAIWEALQLPEADEVRTRLATLPPETPRPGGGR